MVRNLDPAESMMAETQFYQILNEKCARAQDEKPKKKQDMDTLCQVRIQLPLSRQSSSDLMIVKDPPPPGDNDNVELEPRLHDHHHNDTDFASDKTNTSSSSSSGSASKSKNDDYDSNVFMTTSWLKYAGHCPGLDTFLESKYGVFWSVMKFIDALFRGIAQVVFANNPFTGLMITLALFWSDWIVGLAAVSSATLAILTAFVIGQETTKIQAGLTTYSAVLVGCVTASIWTPVYDEAISVKLWIFVAIGSILSVFLTSALANMLSSFRIPLPCLTMPFNIVNLLLFTCFMPPRADLNVTSVQVPNTTMDSEHSAEVDSTDAGMDDLNYVKIFTGIICSMGQIYGVENIFASVLMYIGIIIYSPILSLMGFIGASVGTLCGLVFVPGPTYTTIYAGIWGYNAILSATAIGGFFIPINWLSFFTAIANVVFTVIVQQGLVIAFHDLRLPVFTLPFVLCTFLFLSVGSTNEGLARVTNITFPEMHRFEYSRRIYQKAKNHEQKSDLVQVVTSKDMNNSNK